VAALLTAYYMTRLMIMTFHGTNRSGEKEQHHLHEVAPVMWIPLVILAFLSVVGGWVNVPEALAHAPVIGWIPSSEWVHHWLEPVLSPAQGILTERSGEPLEHAPFGGGEVLWAVLSSALALIVILTTSRIMSTRRIATAIDAPAPRGFARVLANKWYVDEIYDALIVKPILALSRASWRFLDQGLIDGAVNGVGHASRAFGWVGSRLQTGQLNSYAFAIVVGALILLGIVVL
jgi:NADH-quinone oxidoreductase subunit L